MKSHCIAVLASVFLLVPLPSMGSDLFQTFCRLAGQAQGRGDYATAEVMYCRALEQAETYNETDPRLVSTLIRLADIYAHENEYALAEPLYERLLRLAERHPEFDHQVSGSLENLALLEKRTHRHDRSELMKQVAAVLHSSDAAQISNAGLGM